MNYIAQNLAPIFLYLTAIFIWLRADFMWWVASGIVDRAKKQEGDSLFMETLMQAEALCNERKKQAKFTRHFALILGILYALAKYIILGGN